MKKYLLLFLVFGCCYQSFIKSEQCVDAAEEIEELNDDILQQVSELPEEMLTIRELPWYLKIVSKPGAYVFIKLCKLWDWFKDRSQRTKNITLNLFYQLNLKKKSVATGDMAHNE
ncbi:TPA: hypothetical protein DIC20_01340 [Candidatus Dependentiae bacterium]|nr:MAG: hypothetical protein US03_C0002G0124 [candidate division TM6 bacterium GW2011_GWF2_36_131]KKQ03557.1 MAG: hypothetical protein US13_C0002G0123 [candidate division TM6 bacterium GW2011_GWE2_36_25]KKQ20168.1 MAG: hypothetical protein US32_C0001G0065 [candidate division TM6 bacterium GW2011_GWA2_36_9]HBR70709.1 hypothetical protein [Candidatus Dependentiae bacterium]HCU00329.1 hypothetical protein [Candidatus Dependentiae bacterium]